MSQLEYRREIDGLRALAVIPVIFFHAGVGAFKGGYVGVDVFFVISGYLITSILLRELQDGTFTLVGFYERRVRRILPALFFVMAVCTIFAWMWLLPNELRRYAASVVAVAGFSSNVLFYLTSDYFDSEAKPLLHTWSLAVEEQYYLVFPLLLMLAWRLGRTRLMALLAVVAVLSLAAADWYSVRSPQWAFLLLPTRFWELAIGALIAFHLARRGRPWASEWLPLLGLAMIASAVTLFDRNTPFPSLYALLPTLGTGLVILSAAPDTLAGKILGSRVCVGIGLISYSAYLWHQPLLALARHRSLETPGGELVAGLCAGTFLLAYLSWKYVEAPFRSRSGFSRRQVFVLAFAGTVGFVVFGAIVYLRDGFESRMPPEVRSLNIVREHERMATAAGCRLHDDGFRVAECVRGRQGSVPRVALVGDSHAQALTHELGLAFACLGQSFIPYVRLACPFYLDMPESSGEEEERGCVAYQRQIQAEISGNGVEIYILFTRRDYAPEQLTAKRMAAFDAHLRSIAALLEMGKTVVLVYPIPVHRRAVADYMAKNRLFYGNRAEPLREERSRFENRVRMFTEGYDALGVHARLIRVRASDIFCDSIESGQCVSEIDGVPQYFDESHLSNAGARRLAELIVRALPRVDDVSY